jgi:putative FmdB family regulatory protein
VPIYDYLCGNCGRTVEVVHGIHDHGPKFCPECGAEGSMSKAFAPPTIVFKGSGWAKKDRSTSSKPAATTKDEPPSKAGASSGDSGSKSSSSGDGGPSGRSSGEGRSSSESSAASEASGSSGDSPSAGGSSAAPSTGD